MIYSLIKAVVTNNRNDQQLVTWGLFSNESDDYDFRDEQNDAVHKWNDGSKPGVFSARRLDFEIFYADDLKDLTLDQLDSIPLPMLKKVLDHVPTYEKETS